MNNILIFVATNDQAKRINSNIFDIDKPLSVHGLEIETISMKAVKKMCLENGVDFLLLGVDDYIVQYKSLGNYPILFLEGDLEEIFYEHLESFTNIDGYTINKILKDKYGVYKLVSSIPEIIQPKTYVLHNFRELDDVIKKINSEYIVLKPRKYSFSSNNILITQKKRFTNLAQQEILNLHDYIIQEYIPETLRPPKEYRLHFIGRKLCRCLLIVDKNNWSNSFSISDLEISDIPQVLSDHANKISNILVSQQNKDNFTLDFLACKSGYLFLEANCGALGSFYINNENESVYLEPIFREIFKRYFKIKNFKS